METPRLMLDSNVWRYIVDADAVETVRRAAKSKVQIVACPAIVFEALRVNDAVLRRKLAKAMTEGAWKRLMPEAYTETEELHQAIAKHRPEWLKPHPDMRFWQLLKSDWQHNWWRRVRQDPAGEAARIHALEDGDLQAGFAEAKASATEARNNRETFDGFGLNYQVMLPKPVEGWDGRPFDMWRGDGMVVWRQELLLTRRSSTAYYEWIESRLKLDVIASQQAEWVSFWTREVAVTDVPRQWIRCTLNYAQRTRRTTRGTPVDNQIGAYLPDCDVFATSDKALAECIDRIRVASRVRLASSRLLPADGKAIPALLEVINDYAAG